MSASGHKNRAAFYARCREMVSDGAQTANLDLKAMAMEVDRTMIRQLAKCKELSDRSQMLRDKSEQLIASLHQGLDRLKILLDHVASNCASHMPYNSDRC